MSLSNTQRYTGLIDRYRDRLPVSASTRAISLGEGNTPLIKLENIPRLIGKNVDMIVTSVLCASGEGFWSVIAHSASIAASDTAAMNGYASTSPPAPRAASRASAVNPTAPVRKVKTRISTTPAAIAGRQLASAISA